VVLIRERELEELHPWLPLGDEDADQSASVNLKTMLIG
jgi:hypothetical protein